jgi:hypothetical protein
LKSAAIVRLSAAAAKKVFVQKETDQRFHLIILPVTLELENKTLLTYAIINIGAEGKGFINQSWAASHELPLKKLKKPFGLKMFDKRNAKNGIIIHYVEIRLKIKNYCEKKSNFS